MSEHSSEVIDWLQKQPDWMQEMAERWLRQGTLTEDDIKEIADILKSSKNVAETTNRSFESLKTGSEITEELRLVSIGDIHGIENLSPHRPLDFGDGNFVVVYGHNGSGKSGYVRILQQTCGKPYAEELRANVFKPPPTEQGCTITFKIGEEKRIVHWKPTNGPINELRTVDFFNERVAVLYLSEEREITYTPPILKLFQEIANGCERIWQLLDQEQEALVNRLPELPSEYRNTKAGQVYRSLNGTTDQKKIEEITQWSSEDQKKLDTLVERLNTPDPAKEVQKARVIKTQLENLIKNLTKTSDAFSKEKIEEIRRARADAKIKRKAVVEAGNLDVAKLEGVGSPTWRALWEAARAYSQIAYPEKDFPVTEDGAVCVLCHQELAPDAQDRLQRFEEFVQGHLEKSAKAAETAYQKVLSALPEIMDEESILTSCTASDISDEKIIQKIKDFWSEVKKARDLLIQEEKDEEASPVTIPEDLLNALQEKVTTIEKKIEQYNKDAKEFDRIKAENEKLELEARCWTAQQKNSIEEEINRLKKVRQYENWKKAVNSRPVSLKAGELSEKIITETYINRFNEELRRLNASYLKVEFVKTRTSRGTTLHQLRLKGTHRSDIAPNLILSQGERRVVSLAAFLADVGDKPYAAPFVFDDPISSLDQEFEWYVAKRLAELAKERQVIVFTHRLSLYGSAEEAARKLGEDWKKENLEQRYIEAFGGVCGHPADEGIISTTTRKVNNRLLQRLDEAKKAGERGGVDEYRLHAQTICTDFRKLVERTIEDDLLNQVVRRHRRSVTTENRLVELPKIRPEDCSFLDGLMSKYSAFEHSQSTETSVRIPEEPELRQDLEALKEWREEFRRRKVNN